MITALGGAVSEPAAVPIASATDRLDERFVELKPRLLVTARSLVGVDAAEDVVQDAYLRARDRIGQLRDWQALDAWLVRIVATTAFNRHRRRRAFLDRLPVLARPEAPLAPSDSLDELIEQLPPRERTVLVLQHAYGYRLDEIARIVGVSHTNARTIAFRARRRLAAVWREADR